MARPVSKVSRVLVTGPLAPFADAYREKLKERRYTRLSAVNLQRQMARLSHWLDVEALGVEQLSEARVEAFLSFQRGSGRERSALSRSGLLWLLALLRELGVVPGAVQPTPSPTEVLMACFQRYLLSERGLSAGTVRGYVDRARRFVAGLALGGLGRVRPVDVTTAVLRESAAVSVSATQNFVAGLRAFLRFCFIEGLVEADLSEAALPVTGRRRSSLPRGIAKGEAAALLGSCDRRTAIGRRDYALLITLLRLGLRRGEVAGLRLEDIDWRAGELVVVGKGARRDRLPLPADVGEAVVEHLRRRHAAVGCRRAGRLPRSPRPDTTTTPAAKLLRLPHPAATVLRRCLPDLPSGH
jgi:site-specific recombinase XerC